MTVQLCYVRSVPLVLWIFLSTKITIATSTSKYDDCNRWGNSALIHDASSIIRQSKNVHEFGKQFDRKILASFYYEVNDDVSSAPCWRDSNTGQIYSCGYFGITGISLMIHNNTSIKQINSLLGTKTTSNMIDNLSEEKPSFVDAVIFSIGSSGYCYCSNKLNGLTDYVTKKLGIIHRQNKNNSRIKYGIEYNQRFLECCNDEAFPLLEMMEYKILKMEISPLNTMLSYGHFSKIMNRVVAQNSDYATKIISNCSVSQIIRLVIQNYDYTIRSDSYGRYEAVVKKYVQGWMNENGQHENEVLYIIPLSHTNDVISSNSQFLTQAAIPVIYSGSGEDSTVNINLLVCEPQGTVKSMLSIFKKVLLHNPSPPFLGQLVTKCQYENNTLPEYMREKTRDSNYIQVLFDSQFIDQRQFIKSINKILSDKKNVLKISTIYIDTRFLYGLQLDNILGLSHSTNIQVGCFVNDISLPNTLLQEDDPLLFINATVRSCGKLFSNSAAILYHFPIKVYNEKQLLRFLGNFERAKQIFERVYSGKSLVPMMRLIKVGTVEMKFSSGSSLYCDSNIQLVNEYRETIISFANIHNWTSLILVNDLAKESSYQQHVGFWQNVATDESVDRKQISFPLYFRSTAETSFGPEDEQLPMTYSCIKFTETLSQTGINFLENLNAGTYFETTLTSHKRLTHEEMQTMLLYALARFSFVEMIDMDGQVLNQVASVLNPVVLKAIKMFRNISEITRPLVYVEIPLTEAVNLERETLKLVEQNVIAMHVRGWENQNEREWNNSYTALEITTKNSNAITKFGVAIQNCGHEINLKLTRLNKLPFIMSAGYMVCNVRPVLADNLNQTWMEEYLGTLFYTKAYMERFLARQNEKAKRVEIIFRINLICLNGRNAREKFLKFLNDVNQHSQVYGIKYFIVRAFGTEKLAETCTRAWWHLTNYSDLSNQSAFVDSEMEYFGLPTKLDIVIQVNKTFPEANQILSGQGNLYILVIVPVVVMLFFLGLFSLWLQRRHYKSRILTNREITQFYNGNETPQNYISLEYVTSLESTYMQFPDMYEISSNDIEIREVIGRGEFGVVHRGILSERLEVAIKQPRSDCTKEQFKSVLSELKILCYIGSHPNIVSFLGASTKGIQKGKLLIVTEYCAQGSLQSYLRTLKGPEDSGQTEGLHGGLNINQLYEFCHQIACGMEYVAKKRIVHGDLATRNVLLTFDYICKIGDFGLSRRLYELGEYVKKGSEPLPWRWLAPESLTKMEFTTYSDVWSYGVTLWEIFSLGMLPYPGKGLTDDFIVELSRGSRMGRAPFASNTLHNKLLDCWSQVQEERPTFTELKLFFVDMIHHDYQNTTLV